MQNDSPYFKYVMDLLAMLVEKEGGSSAPMIPQALAAQYVR